MSACSARRRGWRRAFRVRQAGVRTRSWCRPWSPAGSSRRSMSCSRHRGVIQGSASRESDPAPCIVGSREPINQYRLTEGPACILCKSPRLPRRWAAAARSAPQCSTFDQLETAVASGFPRAVVAELAAHAAPEGEPRRRVAALVVSPATYKRRSRLSPAASEQAERLARVTALAQQALGDADEAKSWLNAPHPLLGDRAPIDAAATDLGARQVERILHNIEHGLPI